MKKEYLLSYEDWCRQRHMNHFDLSPIALDILLRRGEDFSEITENMGNECMVWYEGDTYNIKLKPCNLGYLIDTYTERSVCRIIIFKNMNKCIFDSLRAMTIRTFSSVCINYYFALEAAKIIKTHSLKVTDYYK